MNFLIGKKKDMTNIFEESGEFRPVTSIALEKMIVTRIFTKDKDGYSAVQVGFGTSKEKHKTKPEMGQMNGVPYIGVKEFRMEDTSKYKVGDDINLNEMFKEGDIVSLISKGKGKGFQGAVKRHNFSGGPKSHGHKGILRKVGSVGTGQLARVARGKKMPGRMGGKQVTTKNVKVLKVFDNENMIYVSGPVSGPRGSYVQIKTQV